jgi:hypothetical protein
MIAFALWIPERAQRAYAGAAAPIGASGVQLSVRLVSVGDRD